MLLTLAPSSAAQDADAFARSVVPLLKDVRRGIESKVSIEPATLPPSPITGRSSTLFAFRVGVKSIDVPPGVVEAMDRLLRWDARQPLSEADRELVERWRQALRIKILGRLAATGAKGVGCDDQCVTAQLTSPGALFGRSRREQIDGRNELLLNALSEAVSDSPAA